MKYRLIPDKDLSALECIKLSVVIGLFDFPDFFKAAAGDDFPELETALCRAMVGCYVAARDGHATGQGKTEVDIKIPVSDAMMEKLTFDEQNALGQFLADAIAKAGSLVDGTRGSATFSVRR